MTYDIKIDKVFKNLIPALSPEERKQLEDNLINDGRATSPLIVWRDGDQTILVDGHNRFEICKTLDLPFEVTELDFENRSQVEEWIIKHQFGQRNLGPIDRAAMTDRLEEVVRARAKENLTRSGKEFGKGKGKGLEKSPNPIQAVNTREELAKLSGLSTNTLARAKKILRAVSDEKLPPETIQKIRDKEESINSVYKQLKETEKPKDLEPEPQPELPPEEEDDEPEPFYPQRTTLTKRQVAALPPCDGVKQANRAIIMLDLVENNDKEFDTCFQMMEDYIRERKTKA